MKKTVLFLLTGIMVSFAAINICVATEKGAPTTKSASQKVQQSPPLDEESQKILSQAQEREKKAYEQYTNAIKNSSSQEVREKARVRYLNAKRQAALLSAQLHANVKSDGTFKSGPSKNSSNYWHKRLDKSYGKDAMHKMLDKSYGKDGMHKALDKSYGQDGMHKMLDNSFGDDYMQKRMNDTLK